jgi:molybdate transport system substrate-binding protein
MSVAVILAGNAAAAEPYLLAGAGLRQPVDELLRDYAKETGIRVRVEYGGSGGLLARIKALGRGDVYLPGSRFYVEELRSQGRVSSSHPVALHTPVVAVWRKTKKTIRKFADLGGPGVRVGLGDPQAMALGRTAEEILRRSGTADRILPNVVVRAATVKQLALYIMRGDVDAGVIGRADAFQFRDTVRMIEIDKRWYTPDVITAAVLKTSRDPAQARRLALFLTTESAAEIFEKYGFLPLIPFRNRKSNTGEIHGLGAGVRRSTAMPRTGPMRERLSAP